MARLRLDVRILFNPPLFFKKLLLQLFRVLIIAQTVQINGGPRTSAKFIDSTRKALGLRLIGLEELFHKCLMMP